MKDGISWLVAINANDFGSHSFGMSLLFINNFKFKQIY